MLPKNNRCCPYYYQASSAARDRMGYYNRCVVSPGGVITSAADTAAIRATAAGLGNTSLKILSYLCFNDIVCGNGSLPDGLLQEITDNPTWVITKRSSSPPSLGVPLIPNYVNHINGAISIASRMCRNAVNGNGLTYPERYVDYAWDNWLGPYDYDGVMIDEFFPMMNHNGIWNATIAGTVAAGTTATQLVTSGASVSTGANGIVRMTSGAFVGKYLFVVGSGGGVNATTLPLRVNIGGVPANGDTFELCTASTATQISGATFYNGLDADLFGTNRAHQASSGDANYEIVTVQAMAMRRLRAKATQNGKPNFIITYNQGNGAGRVVQIREMIADGTLNGILFEGFHGQTYSPNTKTAITLANEIVNTCSVGGNPSAMMMGFASNTTDYSKMRNGYALAMMTNGWYSQHMNTQNVVLDEYWLDLGDAIDPIQVQAQSNGCYVRRYKGGAAVYNPTGATISGISIPGYRKINAAMPPYSGQDTSFNNGAATFSLSTLSGAILVPA